ncbi:MAG: ATP-binding protein [Caldimicrobium sp.]|jgi:PAS domain S-box-containing protein
MRFNLFFFLVLFLIFSFFITVNLFFERSFQREAIELTHKELGLLTHSLSDRLSFILNILPQKYISIENYLKNRAFDLDENFFKTIFIEDFERLTQLRVSYSIKKVPKKINQDFFTEVNIPDRKIIYHLIFSRKGFIYDYQVFLSLDDIFEKFLRSFRFSEKGYAWLISKDGILIYHSTQPDMIGNNIFTNNPICFKCHKDFEIEKLILKREISTGYQYYFSPEKKDKVVYYSKLSLLDKEWIFCISVPYSELMAPINKSMKLHSLIVISIFLSMIILGLLFYYVNTKRITAEEKLKFYSLLEGIIESTQSKIVVIDTNYNIILANTQYAKILKRTKEEIIGINFFDICPQQLSEYRDDLRNMISKAFKGEYGELLGYPLRENGEIRYHHITVTPLKISGEITGAVITCDDITEEINLREQIKNYANQLEELVAKRTEELRTEKEKLSIIMQSVNSGISIIDEEGNITWMNSKMEELLQLYKRKTNTNKINLCELFSKIGDCLNPAQSMQFVQEIVTNGQRKIFQVQTTPFKVADEKTNYICLIQDITELKLMEERIMQSEKLQALARISAGLAHEIGNPLTSISSYVQVLKEMDLGEFPNQALDVISRHIFRISEIIRNISNFAKPTKGENVPTNVSEVLESSLNLVKFDKRMKDINIKLDLKEVPQVMVDPNQLSQVFINIILNAADAMPQGGDLIIETKATNDYVEISFTDTGIGIPPEHLPYIFDPFFTTKEKGTGFGLSVSYSIIKNFGGDIEVRSEVGKGSTFIVKLPIKRRSDL